MLLQLNSPGSAAMPAICLSFRLATIEDRVVPTSSRSNVLDLSWSPGFRVVLKDRRPGFQDRVNDSPSFFHVVFACEQGGISHHRVAEHALIGVHLPGLRAASPGNFDGLVQRFIVRSYAVHADGKSDVRTDSQPAMIHLQIEAFIHRRWLTQPDNNLSAGHGQTFSGTEVERNAAPAPRIDLELEGRKSFRA